LEEKIQANRIFLDNDEWIWTSKLIPTTCPHKIKNIYGFGELFAAVHYLDLKYEVTWEYFDKNWNSPSYRKAVQILGKKAADFICQSHPQPPDLFVVDRKNRFSFVEVKLPTDKLNKKQIAFNRRIEQYLNKNMPQSRRAPHLPKGHWIELLRLSPESDI
jgi:VRR-NUC domain-containing protein